MSTNTAYGSQFKIQSTTNKADDGLTSREIEVLKTLRKGLYYKEVGNELHISTETVKKHLRNIYSKLDVRNKTEAFNKHFN
ncbi:MAG: response regulator transcription factor [Sphingobacteriales bacterium]|nr:response regulator transcription factor [Sphingobacteriales bacterium]MBI3720585.1 response regulator transcription factor [Sphingobacteriales bacterium]